MLITAAPGAGSLTRGYSALSRHPNYFGEILVWVSLTALAGTHGVLVAQSVDYHQPDLHFVPC